MESIRVWLDFRCFGNRISRKDAKVRRRREGGKIMVGKIISETVRPCAQQTMGSDFIILPTMILPYMEGARPTLHIGRRIEVRNHSVRPFAAWRLSVRTVSLDRGVWWRLRQSGDFADSVTAVQTLARFRLRRSKTRCQKWGDSTLLDLG